jgi:hypothetical protein
VGKAYKIEALTNIIWKMEDEGITVRELVDQFHQCIEPYTAAANFLNVLNAIDVMCQANDGIPEGPIAFYPIWFESRDIDGLLDEVHYVRTYDEGKAVLAIESITDQPFIRLKFNDLIVLKHINPQDPQSELPCPWCGLLDGKHTSDCKGFAR